MEARPAGDLTGAARTPESAQAEIDRLRSTVLSGRGPGASTTEFLRSTRARTLLGGVPVPLERDAVARAAAAARRDADGLALRVAAAQTRLSDDLGRLWASGARERRDRKPPRGLRSSRLLRLAVAAGAVTVGRRVLVRRRR